MVVDILHQHVWVHSQHGTWDSLESLRGARMVRWYPVEVLAAPGTALVPLFGHNKAKRECWCRAVLANGNTKRGAKESCDSNCCQISLYFKNNSMILHICDHIFVGFGSCSKPTQWPQHTFLSIHPNNVYVSSVKYNPTVWLQLGWIVKCGKRNWGRLVL